MQKPSTDDAALHLYIFSTLNDRGLPLSVADSNPIDIKLKRERGNQTQNKEAHQTFYEQNNYKYLKYAFNDYQTI